MTKVKAIAIMTEDETDYYPIRTYIERITGISTITFKPKFGRGGGKLRGKCYDWSRELALKGCNLLILVHDRDRNDLATLELELKKCLEKSPILNRYICIPVEELEAWFLADPHSIKVAFGLRKIPKVTGLPEDMVNPKGLLGKLVYTGSNKSLYYTTSMGSRIAPHSNLETLKNRVPSFKKFHEFISSQTF